jgi:cytochrome c oxidase assembly protein subunit 15
LSHDSLLPHQHPHHVKLALLTFLLAFVVILLGAYTRLTDAGLSCPDWPHCFGSLTAPYTVTQQQEAAEHYPGIAINVQKAWTEMVHRYAAGGEGMLILLLALSMLLTHRKFAMVSILLMALLSFQILLGMLTVTKKLQPIIVLGHLLIGLSLLGTLWWAYLTLCRSRSVFTQRHIKWVAWLWLGFIILALQITLGGWVSTHNAGLACIDFPYCNGQLIPAMRWSHLNSDLITIHMLHRIGAVMTIIYFSILGICLLRRLAFRLVGSTLLTLVLLQATLGVLNIVWWRPVSIALIHHAMAIMLLLTTMTALYKAYHGSQGHEHDF